MVPFVVVWKVRHHLGHSSEKHTECDFLMKERATRQPTENISRGAPPGGPTGKSPNYILEWLVTTCCHNGALHRSHREYVYVGHKCQWLHVMETGGGASTVFRVRLDVSFKTTEHDRVAPICMLFKVQEYLGLL